MKLKNISSVLFIILFIFSLNLIAQTDVENKIVLTGNLRTDSKILFDAVPQQQSIQVVDDIPGKKTPVIAGLLSAVIPGAGQFYNGDYWITGIFVALEAAFITGGIIYDNKGDDQTTAFEQFADNVTETTGWSVVRYAKWLNANGADITIDETTPGLQPWERVNWTELNEAETGSHHLYPHGDQQYYEMIGKYHEYIPGWPGGEDVINVPQIMLDYSAMRGQANDYYATAKTYVTGIYINHLLSAIEAVWGASRFNKNLAVKLRVESTNFAGQYELVPTLYVKYSFN